MQLIAAFDGISYNKVLEARKNDNVTEKLKQKKKRQKLDFNEVIYKESCNLQFSEENVHILWDWTIIKHFFSNFHSLT